jgi:addiction module RelB/DinJ family antitoxin
VSVRDRASAVLGNMGLTVSDAVRILLARTANKGTLPLGLLSGNEARDAWFRARAREALNDTRPDVSDDEVRCISLNAERQPVSTRMSANREAYLVCVRVFRSRRHLYAQRNQKIRQRQFWSTSGSLLPSAG